MVRKGFTILELLLVLSVVAIIFYLGYFSYYSIYNYVKIQAQLNASVQNLFFLLVDARREAVVRDVPVCVKFDGNTFFVFPDADLDGTPDGNTISSFTIGDSVEVFLKDANNEDHFENFEFYTYEGLFLKKEDEIVSYQNFEINLFIKGFSKTLRVENSLPEVLE